MIPNRTRSSATCSKGKILSVSLDLFVHRGFADIATGAGISAGLLYHCFAGKDDILAALLQDSLPRMEASAQELEALALPIANKIIL